MSGTLALLMVGGSYPRRAGCKYGVCLTLGVLAFFRRVPCYNLTTATLNGFDVDLTT